MSDENERSVASAGSVADIIDRLLAAVKADAPIQRALVVSAAAEIERLRFAIRRLAEQDATLSVQGGNVIVEMDATRDAPMPSDPFRVDSGPFLGRIIGVEGIASLLLTDEERRALSAAIAVCQEAVDKKLMGWEADAVTAASLRGLLERLGGER